MIHHPSTSYTSPFHDTKTRTSLSNQFEKILQALLTRSPKLCWTMPHDSHSICFIWGFGPSRYNSMLLLPDGNVQLNLVRMSHSNGCEDWRRAFAGTILLLKVSHTMVFHQKKSSHENYKLISHPKLLPTLPAGGIPESCHLLVLYIYMSVSPSSQGLSSLLAKSWHCRTSWLQMTKVEIGLAATLLSSYFAGILVIWSFDLPKERCHHDAICTTWLHRSLVFVKLDIQE